MSSQSLPNDGPLDVLFDSNATNSIPFPTPTTETLPESESSSSNLTSSDKLSALPGIQSSPALGRLLGSRTPRRSFDASASLPAIQSSPAFSPPPRLPTPASRYSESDGSPHGRDTPRQRVSFDSERGSLSAAVHSLRQAVASRASNQHDSAVASPSIKSGESSHAGSRPRQQGNASPRKDGMATPLSQSTSQSRAASPFRLFSGWNLHRAHSRDEPFIPVDPFQLHFRFFSSPTSSPTRPPLELLEANCAETCGCCLPFPITCENSAKSKLRSCGAGVASFFSDTLPRQVYLHLLFRLPALYFSRVSRIFEDAEVSKHEVQRMIEACAPAQADGVGSAAASVGMGMSAAIGGTPSARAIQTANTVYPFPEDWNPPSVSPALSRFKHSWEGFVDALVREWKTLNLVSVLLCTALLTMFQISDAAGDPLTRWAALFSLICAIMSLTYGCVYIVQFGTMRTMYKASRWAEEAQKTKTFIWWNIWVLLAMPAIWLSWAMLAFCLAILSYVWRTGSSDDPEDGARPPLTSREALVIRAILTVLFGMGVVYFIMILRTFASYGEREVGWRRSWLRHGNFGSAERARERQRRQALERDRERGRRRARDTTDQERVPETEAAIAGLGLSGLSSGGNMASASTSDGELDNEKRRPVTEFYGLGQVKGRISPKL